MVTKTKRARTAHGGLCSTCNNDPRCTFLRIPGTAVMECLEFQGESLEVDGRHVEAFSSPRRGKSARHAHEPGLCPLCDKKSTCTFPKPPGGVWLCEEFQ
jgi:hypothetical protein